MLLEQKIEDLCESLQLKSVVESYGALAQKAADKEYATEEKMTVRRDFGFPLLCKPAPRIRPRFRICHQAVCSWIARCQQPFPAADPPSPD